MIAKFALCLALFATITLLYRWAAGSLGLRHINLIGVTYYLYMVLVYIGAALIFMGFADTHYIVARVDESYRDMGFAMIAGAGIALPLVAGLTKNLLGARDARRQGVTVESGGESRTLPIANLDERKLFNLTALFMIFCLGCAVYVFYAIGSVPLVELVFGGNEDALQMRAEAKVEFGGLSIIRDVGMLTLSPILSFVCLIGYETMTRKKWRGILIFSVCLSCFVLSYSLEKAPAILFLLQLFILELLLGKSFSKKQLILIGAGVVFFVALAYAVTAGVDTLSISLTNGPVARTVIAYPAVFMLHLQVFPEMYPFLGGSGFPSIVEDALGATSLWGRSSVLVMSIYNTGGLGYAMNTFFPAEAYDNWGGFGYCFSLLWVGLIMGVIGASTCRRRCSVLMCLVHIFAIKYQIQVFTGGFIDYIYGVSLYSAALLFVLISLTCRKTVTQSFKTETGSRRSNRSQHQSTG